MNANARGARLRWENWRHNHHPEFELISRLHARGDNAMEIALVLQKSPAWVRHRLHKMGLSLNPISHQAHPYRGSPLTFALKSTSGGDSETLEFIEACLDYLASQEAKRGGLPICSQRIDKEGNTWLMIR